MGRRRRPGRTRLVRDAVAAQVRAATPVGVELGLGQRRLGQDPGADRPGGAAAARRHRAAADPLPHLHQGGGGRDAEPAVPDARRLGDARRRRRCAPRSTSSASPARRSRADQLARARTLFARALETPGGLKIQTIHAFCEALLRRFPLEAGVAPQFARARGPPGAGAARGGARRARRGASPATSPRSPGSCPATTPTRCSSRSASTAPASPRRSTRTRLAARPRRAARG